MLTATGYVMDSRLKTIKFNSIDVVRFTVHWVSVMSVTVGLLLRCSIGWNRARASHCCRFTYLPNSHLPPCEETPNVDVAIAIVVVGFFWRMRKKKKKNVKKIKLKRMKTIVNMSPFPFSFIHSTLYHFEKQCSRQFLLWFLSFLTLFLVLSLILPCPTEFITYTLQYTICTRARTHTYVSPTLDVSVAQFYCSIEFVVVVFLSSSSQ